MGVAGLIEIKRRIKSVESTRKLTKAMSLVATSKLRKVRKELTGNEEYNKLSQDIMNKVVENLPEEYESIYFTTNKKSDKLYIVLTSDVGMCAGYNGNIISFLQEEIESSDKNAKIMIVGSKGISYLKKYNMSPSSQYIDIPDIPTITNVKNIYNESLYMFKKGEVSEVYIVYTNFKSPSKQNVELKKILPIESNENGYSNCFIEPDIDKVFNSTVDIYLKNQLTNCMLNAKASEQASRMTAMDSATENANDILRNLKIKYNRIRQSVITQEISEIVGGAEAQK